MPEISQRAELMPASPIRKLVPLAEAARSRGIRIYHLNIGQPDLPSPQTGLAALKKIDRKVLEYSPSDGYRSLREKLAGYYQQYQIKLSPEEIIVTTGGSEAVLFAFMSCLNPGDEIIVPEPAYANYMAFAISAGAVIRPVVSSIEQGFALPDVAEFEKLINERTRGILICNPNNPTSSAIPQQAMRKILDECKRYDICVLIDETYVEFALDYDAVTCVPLTRYYNNLIILRGVSKFFASPGLRLGYAITGNEDLIKRLNSVKNPWTINSLAAIAGELMFSDKDYITKTRELTAKERTRVLQELKSWKTVKVYDSQANFVLVRIEKEGITAEDLFEHAIRRKMMIRNCCTFPFLDNRYIRFCFMHPEQNDALLTCLKELL